MSDNKVTNNNNAYRGGISSCSVYLTGSGTLFFLSTGWMVGTEWMANGKSGV